MKRAMFLSGALGILGEVIEVMILLERTHMSREMYSKLWQIKTILYGAAIGILVLFLSDPEVLRMCRQSFKRSRPPSSNAPSV